MEGNQYRTVYIILLKLGAYWVCPIQQSTGRFYDKMIQILNKALELSHVVSRFVTKDNFKL